MLNVVILCLRCPLSPLKVVFVSPFEHHSNLLPWRDIGAEVCGHMTDLHCLPGGALGMFPVRS